MNTLMLTCSKATQLISVKAYRKLSVSEKVRLRLHLLTCSACKAFNLQSTFIDKALEKLGAHAAHHHHLPEERKASIQNHITKNL